MPELAFRDGVFDRIRLRESRYDERAYLFVLAALELVQQKLPERRHLSGRELAHVEEGRKVIDEVLAKLDDVSKVEAPPVHHGRRMICTLAPK